MQLIHNLQEWQMIRRQLAPELQIGFVPTMGNLHHGHQSLVQACRAHNDITVVSIFINPTQFNRSEDFKHYPKTLEADLALLEQNGVDYCLVPEEQALYPEGFRYRITENQTSLPLEGAKRPGHFDGVLTVVMMWLNLVKPHRSYFGEKDYQQYLLIRDMVKTFFLDIEIIACPTIREEGQLAFSSRNNRLSSAERVMAEQFAKIFHQPKSCDLIRHELSQAGIRVDYVEEQEQRRFAAVYIGDIRLIDNYSLQEIS